jgi:hypothetical protein
MRPPSWALVVAALGLLACGGPAPTGAATTTAARVVAASDEDLGGVDAQLAEPVARAARELSELRRAAAAVVAGEAPRGEDGARLRASSAMTALFYFDGPKSAEARAIGVLVALRRIEIALALPAEAAALAVDGAFVDLFGVFSRASIDDDTLVVRPGAWLSYVVTAAAAAGHPVPDEVRAPSDREALAWAGVREGVADRLRVLAWVLPSDSASLRARLERAADDASAEARRSRERCARRR